MNAVGENTEEESQACVLVLRDGQGKRWKEVLDVEAGEPGSQLWVKIRGRLGDRLCVEGWCCL